VAVLGTNHTHMTVALYRFESTLLGKCWGCFRVFRVDVAVEMSPERSWLDLPNGEFGRGDCMWFTVNNRIDHFVRDYHCVYRRARLLVIEY
jgi:hypothetical protein